MPSRGGGLRSRWVAPLEAIGRHDLERVGGKGANLGELVRGGFPVPAGFVVTTAAYERFVDQARLGGPVADALGAGGDDSTARAIRDAFLAATIPEEIRQAVSAAYRDLAVAPAGEPPEVPVAVRSSATAEDLAQAAFAGQQDTYLNVVGLDGLLDALVRCWASLWTGRAIAYRRRVGLADARVSQAVVVQRMVFPEVAGVLLTANPVTGRRDELVIDASPGLGEAVVSGLVTPDHYEVDRRSLRVTRWQAGRSEVVVRALPGGGTEQIVGQASAEPALAEPVVGSLARMGTRIERHFRVPQDIEWALAGGGLYVLQARPITALPPREQPGPRQRRKAGILAEVFPIRPYPLDVSAYTAPLLASLADLVSSLGVTFPTADELFVEEDGVVVRLGAGRPQLTWRVLLMPWVTLWRARHVDVARWEQDPALEEAARTARALESRDLSARDWAGVLRTVDDASEIGNRVMGLRIRYGPPALRDLALFRGLLAVARQGGKAAVLLSGVETKTLELNRALEGLAAQVRAAPGLRDCFAATEPSDLLDALAGVPSAGPFLGAFRDFLERYGHRETVVTLVSQPAWKDALEVPLGLIKGLAAGYPPAASSPPPAWATARDDLLSGSVLGSAPLRRLFLRLLDGARRALALREDTHFYLTLVLPPLRRSLLELGRRLVMVGALDEPMEVFHLKLAELEGMGRAWPPSPEATDAVRATVARRKAKRASLDGRPLVDPRLVAPSAPELQPGALLVGSPASPGLATGPVRVVLDASQFGALRPGEVLVAPFTNPAWTPLFQRASAVVVETGGLLSHAAIVAREYGIPAVMAAAGATHILSTGQRVRVDGARGLVWPDDPSRGARRTLG